MRYEKSNARESRSGGTMGVLEKPLAYTMGLKKVLAEPSMFCCNTPNKVAGMEVDSDNFLVY